MWFCTDRGVSKFNGFSFVNFTKKDGLSGNIIIDYYKETESKIWLIASNGSLSILENDIIRPYQYNDNLKSFHPSLRIRDLSVLNDTVFIGSRGYNAFSLDIMGNISLIMSENKGISKVYDHRIDLLFSGGLRPNPLYLGGVNETQSLIIRFKNKEINFELDSGIVLNGNNCQFIEINKNLFCFSMDKYLFFFDQHSYLYDIELPSRVIFSNFQDESLWIGTISNGGYQLKEVGEEFEITNRYLNDKAVSSFTIDKNNSIWITTLKNAVYYCINPNITLPYSKTIGEPSKIWLMDNILFSTDLNNRLAGIDISTNALFFLRYFRIKMPTVKVFNDTLKVFFYDTSLVYNKEKNVLAPYLYDNTQNPIAPIQFKGKNGKKIKTDFNRFIYLSNSDSTRLLFEDKIIKLSHDLDTNLWVASETGLHMFDYEKLECKKGGVRFSDFYIQSENVFGATRGEGLFFSDGDTNVTFSKKEGLISDQLNSISSINKWEGWATSNEGLSKYSLTDQYTFASINYGVNQGLISSELYQVVFNQDYLFISSKKGVMRIPQGKLSVDYDADLFLKEIKLNGELISDDVLNSMTQSVYQLNEELNSLEVDLIPLCLNCLSSQEIKVVINGTEQIINNNKVLFNSLKSGEYKIDFWIKNGNEKWVKADFQLRFIIPTPLWQKAWFLMLISLIVVLVLVSLTLFIIQAFKKRQIERLKMVEYQQSALLLQMKPHFIFNAMNSIQAKLLEGDKYDAHQYISKFGQLMRKNLEYSDSNLISIEKELKIISLYVELENRRLANPVNFSVAIGADIDDRNMMIPPFILQPIVENSIWHGLIDNQIKDGYILITISRDNSNLFVAVEDNGIGLEESLKNRSSDHVSKGTMILKKRLKLLQTRSSKESYYSLIDRKENGERGTLLQISLPLVYEKMEGDNIR